MPPVGAGGLVAVTVAVAVTTAVVLVTVPVGASVVDVTVAVVVGETVAVSVAVAVIEVVGVISVVPARVAVAVIVGDATGKYATRISACSLSLQPTLKRARLTIALPKLIVSRELPTRRVSDRSATGTHASFTNHSAPADPQQ